MKAIDKERLRKLFEEDFIYQFVQFIETEYRLTDEQLKRIKNKIYGREYQYRYVLYLLNYRRKNVNFDPIIQLKGKYLDYETYFSLPVSDSDTDESDESDLATEKIQCNHCEIEISYIKDKDRYVSCPRCHEDMVVGSGKESKFTKSQIKKFLLS